MHTIFLSLFLFHNRDNRAKSFSLFFFFFFFFSISVTSTSGLLFQPRLAEGKDCAREREASAQAVKYVAFNAQTFFAQLICERENKV